MQHIRTRRRRELKIWSEVDGTLGGVQLTIRALGVTLVVYKYTLTPLDCASLFLLMILFVVSFIPKYCTVLGISSRNLV